MPNWILDMDGVLVDSEKFMALAAKAALEDYATELKAKTVLANTVEIDIAAFEEFTGTGEIRYISGVAEKYGIPVVMKQVTGIQHFRNIYDLKERAYSHYEKLVQGEQITLPGVPAFMHKVQANGDKVAIATGADKRKMLINLKIMGFNIDSLDAYVTGDDSEVTEGKPHPQIFQLAAQRLESTVANCIVAEDSPNGIRAARRGKFRCVGITTTYTQADLQSILGKETPNWYAPNLANLPTEIRLGPN